MAKAGSKAGVRSAGYMMQAKNLRRATASSATVGLQRDLLLPYRLPDDCYPISGRYLPRTSVSILNPGVQVV